MIRAFAVLALMAGGAAAQSAFDIQPTLDCLDQQGEAGDRRSCIGVAAGLCMGDAMTTPAMGSCFEQELDWWDGALNDSYREARAIAKAADADLDPPLNVQEASLRDMQRAWIAYRDARCAWEASLWTGGTGAGPAFLGCLMHVTGEQQIIIGVTGMGQ